MSEIKGQLLGVVLVVAIFGAIGGLLYAAFQNAAKSTASKIEETPTFSMSEYSLNNSNLLRY